MIMVPKKNENAFKLRTVKRNYAIDFFLHDGDTEWKKGWLANDFDSNKNTGDFLINSHQYRKNQT